VKEATSTVDIGCHFAALNTNNVPVDTDGDGLADWFEDRNGNGTYVQSAIPVIGPDHVACTFWFERTGSATVTNWIRMRRVQNRGATNGSIYAVRQLVTTNSTYGNLELLRSNTATNTDTFRVFPFPVPAVNSVKTNHLYVAYADKGTNANDKADIFFVGSTNGGTNWTSPARVNTVWTNDQWMPVLAVKPDGTKLFKELVSGLP
jgi:hypothetical protein